MLAIEEAPADVSEKLFSGVISQIPLNLYLRNERIAAFKAAQSIEAKFGSDPKRLLGLASFYLGIERGDEAVRVASKAVTLLPDSAEAHYSLGLGLHISLRLDDAANEYRRAIELDSNFRAAHRSLADLNRAAGKAEEALVFYREQLNADPKDKLARAGVVLSLLDVGRTEEGEKELEAALVDDPRNVSLLAGSAYWFAAHANSKRALELATRAVEIEPRYTWSQIALSRALLGEKKPLEAERALRFARQYGKFPTLDYELATVLAAMGLYEEAAEVLSQSFWLKGNEIETRLAGRILSRSESFPDLLAPERKASLFQNVAADTSENARLLKALLAFAGAAKGSLETAEESAALVVAGKAFAAGPDPMRIYRQLFVASRLLRLNKGLEAVNELTQAAISGVDEALEVPAVTVAVQADELRDYRSRAIASGGTPQIPEAPRTVLSSILRGRIEDITGWTLFYQDKPAEALEHLQRAVNVLPPRTPSWRTALWHLGAAQETTGSKQEALDSYIKSYVSGEPDPARRALIERLYAELNGSLEGLDQKIGAATTKVAEQPIVPVTESAGAAGANETSAPATDRPVAEPSSNPVPSAEVPAPNPSTEAPSAPSATPTESPSPEVAQPSATPSPEPSPTETQPESAPPAKPENQPTRTNPEPSLADLPPQPPKAPKSLKLTGSIKDAAGVGIANVVVVLISPRGSVLASTTDSEGNYSFTVSPSAKAFRVLPSKEGLTFTPLDKTLMLTTEDRNAVDFVGNPTP
jgi:tetratricopeptide (TPR) repeat protein